MVRDRPCRARVDARPHLLHEFMTNLHKYPGCIINKVSVSPSLLTHSITCITLYLIYHGVEEGGRSSWWLFANYQVIVSQLESCHLMLG